MDLAQIPVSESKYISTDLVLRAYSVLNAADTLAGKKCPAQKFLLPLAYTPRTVRYSTVRGNRPLRAVPVTLLLTVRTTYTAAFKVSSVSCQ